jgi:mxaA protein
MRNCSASFCCRGLAQAAFLLALLAWPVLSQAQAILANDVVEPRTFGYVVGDRIRREVHLSLHSGYRLDEAGLPKAGRLDRWLELAAPEVSAESIRNGRRYHLVLTYQIFNAPRTLQTITIPQQDLRIIGKAQAITTLVPALRVTVAPVTSGIAADRLSGSSLQQDRAPAPLPFQARQNRLTWTGVALLALLLFAGSRRGVMAFNARSNLPFARAARELKRLKPAAPADYAAGLKIVHDAVNRTAGRAVFAHNLGDFLAVHSEFAGLRDDFEQLFAASGRVFFANPAAGAPPGGTAPALLRLCRLCSRIERRSERQSFEARSPETPDEPRD